jgi:exonuclease III
MLDHLLVCRDLLAYYRDSKMHMSYSMMKQIACATEGKFPESNHAPVIAEFELSDYST